jgi:polyferredoxin
VWFLLSEYRHSGSQGLIRNAVTAVALVLGSIGFDRLKRGGHQRARRILRNSIIVTLLASATSLILLIALILFDGPSLYKMIVLGWVSEYSLYLLWLIWAASYPLALYLNRKQNKPTPQPTIANAR